MHNNIWLIVIALFAAAFILKRIGNSPSFIGKAGENRVARILTSLPGEYQVLNNVIIPHQNGTSQIDHIVVSPFGIFVIETKNYEGWIYGAERSEEWKQTFRTTKAHNFYNPIKQNWGHIYTLSSFLKLDKSVFRPIIVFSNKATLKIQVETPVVHMSQLKREILSYTQRIISENEVEIIADRLIHTNLAGRDNEKKHIQSVKNNVVQKQQTLRNGRCPRCGAALVLRNGKYGDFYGCSNYPKCRFTQNVKQ